MRQILDLMQSRFGFQFRAALMDLTRARVSRRMEELGIDQLQDYYFRLLYDKDGEEEIGHLFDAVANNETYFFREESQIWTFVQEILPSLREESDESRVRVWSAGCSTGEEPYSIAMAVRERLSNKEDTRLEIFATDQSMKVLERAREGLYTAFSFRNTKARIRDRYFQEEENGRFRILPCIRRMVQFGRCNLLGSAADLPLVKFQAIFCRNVLIYLDKEARRQVLDLFHDRLMRGGYLFLGHSESLLDLSDRFEFASLERDVAYRKGGK
ncbi:MAG: CheR family methyltransferase [Acidobacteriota bacterium]